MKKTTSSKLIIDGEVISFYYFDRQSDTTLFCIHGINSSRNFIGNLQKYARTYNVFSYSYGEIQNLTIDRIVNITKQLMATHFSSGRIIVVAHSFGAYIATRLRNNRNIIKYIFINPIHPLAFTYRPFQRMLTFSAKKPLVIRPPSNTTSKAKRASNIALRDVLGKHTKWHPILAEMSKRQNELKKSLMALVSLKNKARFIRSSGDFIISGRLLKHFLKQHGIQSKIIRYPGHAPLARETKRTFACFGI